MNDTLHLNISDSLYYSYTSFIRFFQRIFSCRLIVLLLFIFSAQFVHAQEKTRTQLEFERERLLSEIEATNSQLKQTQENKKTVLQQYLSIKNRIGKRQALISTLGQEVAYIDKSIDRTEMVIGALSGDVDRLHEEYGKMLRQAYRQKLNASKWMFLLSATSFNQAAQRWRYLQQYDDYRKKQERLIKETKRTLEYKVIQLKQDKNEKQSLIVAAVKQQNLLNAELKERNVLLGRLKTDEAQFAKNLEEKEQERKKLDQAIERIIRAAAIAAQEKAESGTNRVENVVNEAAGFKGMLGQLPWPVRGTIVKQFGKHAHPEYANVFTTNNGIDIQTAENATVKAVYKGTVVGKQFIPGYQNMLIIAHGSYYTVYSNLNVTMVNKGDKVTTGQIIGRVGGKKNEMHFEVWKEKQRMNPADWIRK